MNVRYLWILSPALCFAGCVATPPAAMPSAKVPTPAPLEVDAVEATKVVETRYEVRAYRDSADPSVRHESHAVFRRTRVPLNAPDRLDTVPRDTFAPASAAPLPANGELDAELAAQRQITAELRAMRDSLAETGEEMQAQYATLVRQSAETVELRERLEKERARLQHSVPVPAAPTAPTPAGASAGTPEVKW
jgi:hypothetical protein